MEFVVSKRGKRMLIFDGLKYVFGYTSQTNVSQWKLFHEKLSGQYFGKRKIILETKGKFSIYE